MVTRRVATRRTHFKKQNKTPVDTISYLFLGGGGEEFELSYKNKVSRAVVAHAFNPTTWEVEAGGFLSSRPAWSTE
jgi:hypothetical protein